MITNPHYFVHTWTSNVRTVMVQYPQTEFLYGQYRVHCLVSLEVQVPISSFNEVPWRQPSLLRWLNQEVTDMHA